MREDLGLYRVRQAACPLMQCRTRHQRRTMQLSRARQTGLVHLIQRVRPPYKVAVLFHWAAVGRWHDRMLDRTVQTAEPGVDAARPRLIACSYVSRGINSEPASGCKAEFGSGQAAILNPRSVLHQERTVVTVRI